MSSVVLFPSGLELVWGGRDGNLEGSGVDSAVSRDGEEGRMDRGDGCGRRSGGFECRDRK